MFLVCFFSSFTFITTSFPFKTFRRCICFINLSFYSIFIVLFAMFGSEIHFNGCVRDNKNVTFVSFQIEFDNHWIKVSKYYTESQLVFNKVKYKVAHVRSSIYNILPVANTTRNTLLFNEMAKFMQCLSRSCQKYKI